MLYTEIRDENAYQNLFQFHQLDEFDGTLRWEIWYQKLDEIYFDKH